MPRAQYPLNEAHAVYTEDHFQALDDLRYKHFLLDGYWGLRVGLFAGARFGIWGIDFNKFRVFGISGFMAAAAAVVAVAVAVVVVVGVVVVVVTLRVQVPNNHRPSKIVTYKTTIRNPST